MFETFSILELTSLFTFVAAANVRVALRSYFIDTFLWGSGPTRTALFYRIQLR